MPASWDLVRRAVDAYPVTPRFLLTGSATAPTHTGAGRIVTVRMRPLSLAERFGSTTSVPTQTSTGLRSTPPWHQRSRFQPASLKQPASGSHTNHQHSRPNDKEKR